MTDILQAARSYYGLADTESCTTQLFTNQAGQTCVAFEIALSNEDFTAIVERMKAMQQPDTQPDTAIIEGPTVEAMREAYNDLSKAQKGRYGSFSNYLKEGSHGIVEGGYREAAQRFIDACEGRQFVHVEALGEPVRGSYEEQAQKDIAAAQARVVTHVDAPEQPEPVSMDAVWLWEIETTPAQRQFASDTRGEPSYGREYLVQWAMLTDEQKQKAKEKP